MQDTLNISYPVLPLRDIVVFPHLIVPLFVGREKSVHALEEVGLKIVGHYLHSAPGDAFAYAINARCFSSCARRLWWPCLI